MPQDCEKLLLGYQTLHIASWERNAGLGNCTWSPPRLCFAVHLHRLVLPNIFCDLFIWLGLVGFFEAGYHVPAEISLLLRSIPPPSLRCLDYMHASNPTPPTPVVPNA